MPTKPLVKLIPLHSKSSNMFSQHSLMSHLLSPPWHYTEDDVDGCHILIQTCNLRYLNIPNSMCSFPDPHKEGFVKVHLLGHSPCPDGIQSLLHLLLIKKTSSTIKHHQARILLQLGVSRADQSAESSMITVTQ